MFPTARFVPPPATSTRRRPWSWRALAALVALSVSVPGLLAGEPTGSCEPTPPIWATVDVTSTLPGIRVESTAPDVLGRTSGLTPVTFSYYLYSSTLLVAPRRYVDAQGRLYIFWRWNLNGVAAPVGIEFLYVDMIRLHYDAMAEYQLVAVPVEIQCTGPQLQTFELSDYDVMGRRIGTSFYFRPGTTVLIAAPEQETGANGEIVFERWLQPTQLPRNERVLSLVVNDPMVLTVETAWAVETFGSGCEGSNGTPAFAAGGHASIGDPYTAHVDNLAPGSFAFFVTGFSRSSWQGLPLPIDLGLFGWTGCQGYTSGDLVRGVFADASGQLQVTRGPFSAFMLGFTFYDQVFAFDAQHPRGISTSDALATTVAAR